MNFKTKIIFLLFCCFVLSGCGDKENASNKKESALQKQEIEKQVAESQKSPIEQSTVENLTGKVVIKSLNVIEVTREGGEKMTLNVPSTGVSFLKKTKNKDGTIALNDIGLLNIPQDKIVNIQYNPQNRDVRLIVVE